MLSVLLILRHSKYTFSTLFECLPYAESTKSKREQEEKRTPNLHNHCCAFVPDLHQTTSDVFLVFSLSLVIAEARYWYMYESRSVKVDDRTLKDMAHSGGSNVSREHVACKELRRYVLERAKVGILAGEF